jgi:hypothetical protein
LDWLEGPGDEHGGTRHGDSRVRAARQQQQ